MVYTYSTSDGNNALGRLESVTNGTTTTSYEYGLLGEITGMSRTIDRMTPLAEDLDASFTFTSDYLGRMEKITYPDREELTYEYDEGGQIISAGSTKPGIGSFSYVKDIGYDQYGQRVYMTYNDDNGITTRYEYDEHRRWLKHLETVKSDQTTKYQDIAYTFDNVGNILRMENLDTQYHSTEQEYVYDGFYQLISAEGSYSYKPYGGSVTMTSDYTQSFSYDNIGNMTEKVSSEMRSPNLGTTALDYSHQYSYYSNAPHRAEVIGDMYYTYDGNGNLTEERLGGHRPEELRNTFEYTAPTEDVTKADQAWGWRTGDTPVDTAYSRQYEWDEENRLKKTTDPSHTTNYSYDHEGERSIKYSDLGETLYFDSLWLCTDVPGDSLRQTKNIYIGESRVASKISREGSDYSYERDHTFFYHADHLGSSNVVTDNDGNVYEHLEYTPYGETWIEDQSRDDFGMIPYHFTSKERDEETGLYYMSARYQNPVTSRWVSSDPSGWGLIDPNSKGYSFIEGMNWYNYCGNNPINYVDPTGEYKVWGQINRETSEINYGISTYYDYHCRVDTFLGYTIDAISNIVPFHQPRLRAEQFLNNYIIPFNHPTFSFWEINDSRMQPIDGASLALDIIGLTPAGKASDFITAISAALTTQSVLSSLMRGPRTDRNMDSFLSSFRSGIFKNCNSPEEATLRSTAFSVGANAFYDYDLEEKGISFNSWSDSLKNVLNGVNDEQYNSVIEKIASGEYE